MTHRRLLIGIALASIVAVLAYPVVVLLLGLRIEGYSHLRDQISELGLPGLASAPVLTAVLVVNAVLVLGLAYAVRHSIGRPQRNRGAVILLATFGVALLIGGLFPCDADCRPTSFHGWMHVLNVLPSAVATIGAPFLMQRAFADVDGLALFSSGSFILGILVVASALSAFTLFPLLGFGGLGQRLVLGLQLAFLVMVASAVIHVNLHRPPEATA